MKIQPGAALPYHGRTQIRRSNNALMNVGAKPQAEPDFEELQRRKNLTKEG
jgi:hypothetical protein